MLATAKHLAAFLRRPDKHPLCGHAEVWLSRFGVWVCAICHPPPPGVAVWPPPEELPPRVEAVSAKQQEQPVGSDLWPYPALPGQPDPIDFRFDPATGEWKYRPGWWRKL